MRNNYDIREFVDVITIDYIKIELVNRFIKRRKEAVDGKKAQIYSKIGKELTVAVKQGGPDPANNAKLRDVIAKAKANNMPNDNINRCIQKASGEGSNRRRFLRSEALSE